jgi:transcription antitermination protein NusB
MISRRNIRVKAMQSVYIMESSTAETQPAEALKILNRQLDQTRKLLVYLVYFLTETARYAEKDALRKANKHLPSESDLKTSTKIAGNELVWRIVEEPSFSGSVNETKPQQLLDETLLKKTYEALLNTEEYQEYIATPARDKKNEKAILEFIFTHLMLPNEAFINHIEELFINWDDDAEMMNLLVLNLLQKPHQFNFNQLVGKEKKDFAVNLLETTFHKKELCMELLKPKLKNWDAERIAALDLIIIRMGICEFLFFETIPTRVTINEYIDLAKAYSTPQSGQFINGILDNIHKELTVQGKIDKKTFKNSTL